MSFIQALQDIFSLPAIEAAAWGCATCFLISVLLVLTKKLHGSATMDLSNGFKSEVDAPGQDKTLKHVPSYPRHPLRRFRHTFVVLVAHRFPQALSLPHGQLKPVSASRAKAGRQQPCHQRQQRFITAQIDDKDPKFAAELTNAHVK